MPEDSRFHGLSFLAQPLLFNKGERPMDGPMDGMEPHVDREIPQDERRRRILFGGLKIAAGLAGGVAVVVVLVGLLRPSLERSRIRLATVERGALEAVITAAGTVQPAAEEVIASPTESRILRVRERPGAVVEAGRAILDLDGSSLRLHLAELRSEISRAESRRLELELDLRSSLIDLESRRESQVLEVEELEYRLEQRRQLFAEGLVAEAALREAETGLEKARITVRRLDRELENARETTAARIAQVDADLRAAGAKRAEARLALERAVVRAERPGVVTWVLDEEGAAVRRGDVLVRLADLDSFHVEARISDLHAARLAAGMPVRVPLGDETLRGRIVRVLPAVDEGVARFVAELDAADHEALRANLRVDVLVVVDRAASALKLAKGPFANGPGRLEVFVVDGDRARKRRVELGLSGEGHYEVLEGLEEGETVVVSDVEHVLHLEEIDIR